jgi:hypothetical protein
MGSCLATFDQFAVNFLKAKQLKTFPGGVFSLIVKIFNLSVFAGCLIFYFFQSSHISVNYQSSQFNSDIPSFTPKESTINITISQYGSPMDQSQIDYIYSYFKMVVYSRNNNDITVNLIRPEFINNAIQFTIPNDVLNVNITEVNFPRISLESCATLQSLSNSRYFKFNESDLTEINNCNSNLNEFYENAYIKNKVFIYKITTLHHQLTKDYELKSDIRNISYPFTFQNETHDVFVTERKKIAVLFDNTLFKTNKNYDVYLMTDRNDNIIGGYYYEPGQTMKDAKILDQSHKPRVANDFKTTWDKLFNINQSNGTDTNNMNETQQNK